MAKKGGTSRTSLIVRLAALCALTACDPTGGLPDGGAAPEGEGGAWPDASDTGAPDAEPDGSDGRAPHASESDEDAGPLPCTTHRECDDGAVCNGEERCVGGLCAPGKPVACSIAHPCREAAGGCDCAADDGRADGDAFIDWACGGPDCDDSNTAIYPGRTEVCDANHVDEDCKPTTYNHKDGDRNVDGDADADGYVSAECMNVDRESGKPHHGKDCDDGRDDVHPGQVEACDTLDNDCNGTVDEAPAPDGGESQIFGGLRGKYFPDFDDDGCGDRNVDAELHCEGFRPPNYVGAADACDCNDQNPTVNSRADEICDGLDNNCDGKVDDDDNLVDEYYFNDTDVTCVGGDWTILPEDCPKDRLLCSESVERGCTTDATELHSCRACNTDCKFACGQEGCDEIEEVSAGMDHTCARTREGLVACWGRGGDGRLGNDATGTRAMPVPVSGLSDARAVVAGHSSTCAIAGPERALYCWGSNACGRLANGDVEGFSAVPVPVRHADTAQLTGVKHVAIAECHTCAVLDNGELLCWGSARDGRLANLSPQDTVIPIPRNARGDDQLPLDDVTAAAVGRKHGCAIRRGELLCWGDNSYGQLGQDPQALPGSGAAVPVPGLTTVTAVAAGDAHTCAVSGGQVYCFGDNIYLQLGRPAGANGHVPTVVAGLSDIAVVEAALAYTCALDSANAMWCWGANSLANEAMQTLLRGPNLRESRSTT